MNNKHLILISIGPVQDFIAAARKLRDLWFGSTMLSELGKAVARCLVENNCTLIFPSVSSDQSDVLKADSDYSVVNKILADIPAGSVPENVMNECKTAFKNQIAKFAEGALQKAKKIGVHVDESMFHAQVDDIGEFYAAWTPLNENYPQARERVEILLAGRKATRDFVAPAWDGAGRFKSSLDGGRETVLNNKHPEIRGLLKKGERLDSIGLIKRFYPLQASTPHFDDLSDIAVIPFFEAIKKNEEAKELLNEFQACFKDTPYEKGRDARRHSQLDLKIYSDVFFNISKKDGIKDIDQRVESKARELFKKICRKAVGSSSCEQFSYAGILVGDGDHMGTTINEIQTDSGHLAFGKELSRFASEARRIVESHQGSLIYSGGDDVMAYLPMHTLLECAQELRESFAESIGNAIKAVGISPSRPPTFSAGVAIVHHTEPLGNALNIAREAERIAKREGGRNALAITQNKHNGSPRLAYGKWGDFDFDLNTIQRLYQQGVLPGTLPYQLLEIGKQVGCYKLSIDDTTKQPLNTVTACALRCIDAKAFNREGENDKPLQARNDFCELLAKSGDIRRFSQMIIIARQLSKVHKTA